MSPSPASDLAVLREGWLALQKRPAGFAGLVAVGMLLGAVGPLLQRLVNLPTDPTTSYLVGVAGLFPMELYFLPRFLLRLDAEGLGHPQNPAEGWRAAFEARWLRMVLAKVGINLAIGVGILPFILPGLFLLFAFGWAPMRVLLRGEPILVAMRESFALMRRSWRRAFLMVSAALTVTFFAAACLMAAGGLLLPSPEPWRTLAHPVPWLFNAASVAVNVWLSATLLATYQRLEGYSEPVPSSTER
jgi:hypothetical protein